MENEREKKKILIIEYLIYCSIRRLKRSYIGKGHNNFKLWVYTPNNTVECLVSESHY